MTEKLRFQYQKSTEQIQHQVQDYHSINAMYVTATQVTTSIALAHRAKYSERESYYANNAQTVHVHSVKHKSSKMNVKV